MEEKVDSTISLEWKLVTKRKLVDLEIENFTSPGFDNLEEQQRNHPANISQSNTMQEDIHIRQSSARSKKLPMTRNSDFYGKIKF
jgi:hypothetical protein